MICQFLLFYLDIFMSNNYIYNSSVTFLNFLQYSWPCFACFRLGGWVKVGEAVVITTVGRGLQERWSFRGRVKGPRGRQGLVGGGGERGAQGRWGVKVCVWFSGHVGTKGGFRMVGRGLREQSPCWGQGRAGTSRWGP